MGLSVWTAGVMLPMECRRGARRNKKDEAVTQGEMASRNSTKKTRQMVLPRALRGLLLLLPGESLIKQAAEASESVEAQEESGDSLSCSIMPNTAV